jgi:lipopolysaccharide/colanic/teichoic acid biosynthesis glycosyltransferase
MTSRLPASQKQVERTALSTDRLQGFVTRSADIVLSAMALIMLLPLLLGIAVLVRSTSPGPALFKQVRIGKDRKPFTCYKFRTMHPDCDDAPLRDVTARQLRGEDTSTGGSWKIADDDRVTGFGSLLRQTSLDELPQLLNVLRGDMSMVGPRPMLDWQVDAFPREFDARFSVRPGITGLWQVSGRSTVGALEMLRFDVSYVHRRTVRYDLVILMKTIPVLLRRDGAR